MKSAALLCCRVSLLRKLQLNYQHQLYILALHFNLCYNIVVGFYLYIIKSKEIKQITVQRLLAHTLLLQSENDLPYESRNLAPKMRMSRDQHVYNGFRCSGLRGVKEVKTLSVRLFLKS